MGKAKEKNPITIPQEVLNILTALNKAGHEAYIVGGCVRDILRQAKPKDWDITTSAKPEKILKLFPHSFYENAFLTVTVKTESDDPTLREIEITTFRTEGKYTDKRHPDEIKFAKTLVEDLGRRDFTVNAMAISVAKSDAANTSSVLNYEIIDPFAGQKDLHKKIIRAVGNAEKRFDEDALRMLRAVRLSVELGFAIETNTYTAIKKLASNLCYIAKERIRDEFIKIIMTPRAKEGIELLHQTGLLKEFIPEIEEGIGVENRPRIFTIWEHNLRALEYAAQQNYSLDVRLAALLHDVGKPRTKGPMKNDEWTFYGHDVVGAKMTRKIMERLRFSKKQAQKISTLVRWHLFKYEIDKDDQTTTDSSIRRLIRKVGAENIEDLVMLRICDRMGMGVPKPLPYRLRHFQFRVEKILREEEAPSPKMLKINGNDVMNILGISPGPKVGQIIEILLQEVIDDPTLNNRPYLEERIRQLGTLKDNDLLDLYHQAEKKIESVQEKQISEIKKKYYVK